MNLLKLRKPSPLHFQIGEDVLNLYAKLCLMSYTLYKKVAINIFMPIFVRDISHFTIAVEAKENKMGIPGLS